MTPTPLTQFLSNNQKEITTGVFALVGGIIAGIFLLASVAMNKETPAPAPTTNICITINISVPNPPAPVAPGTSQPSTRRARKPYHKQHRRSVAKPLPQPNCPCPDSTKTGA